MATITLSACPATAARRAGCTTISMRWLDRLGEPETVEVRTLDDVRAAVQRFGTALAGAHQGASFIVSISVQRGSRKPNGFDAAQRGNALGTETWLKTEDATMPVPVAQGLPASPGLAAGAP